MSLISGTSRQPLSRHRRTPMAAAGVYRRPLTGGGTAMGFDEDTTITYAGGSVTVPADQDAVLYPAGTSPVLNLDTTGYCLFIQPGSPILWACLQEQYAAVATAIDIVPRVAALGRDDLWLAPRHVVPPPPPGSPVRYLRVDGFTTGGAFLGNWLAGFVPDFTCRLDLVSATPGTGGESSQEVGATRDATPPRFSSIPPVLPGYQFISEPLAARHVPAGMWTIGYLPAIFDFGVTLGYTGYAWIGLASGATITPVSVVGAGIFCVDVISGGTSHTIFGSLPGVAIDIPAGDRLVLELGFQSSRPGPINYVVYTGGADLVVANGIATRRANSYISAPIPL